jgi:hypothetical protein
MGIIAGTPMQLRAGRDAYGHGQVFDIVQNGFVLIDLINSRGMAASEVLDVSGAGVLNVRVSDEITWKLACRTDRNGYLHLLPPITGPQRPETAWRDTPMDSLPTVCVNLGTEFGLWWTYSWRQFLIELQGPGRAITRERQLQRISTYIEATQLPAFEALVNALDRATGQSSEAEGAEFRRRWAREAEETRREWSHGINCYHLLFLAPSYRNLSQRTMAQADSDLAARLSFLNSRRRPEAFLPLLSDIPITPHVRVEDDLLQYAWELADEIDRCLRFIRENEIIFHQEAAAKYLRILNGPYHEQLNTVVENARRDERIEHPDWRIRTLRDELRALPGDLRERIRAAGRILVSIFSNAIFIAQNHYSEERSREYSAYIVNAVGAYVISDLVAVVSDDEKTRQAVARIRAGEIQDDGDAVDRFFSMLGKVIAWHGNSLSTFESFVAWLYPLIDHTARTGEEQRHLRNLLHIVAAIGGEDPAGAEPSSLSDSIEIRIGGRTIRTSFRGWRLVNAGLEKVGLALRIYNAVKAMHEVTEDPNLKNTLSAAGSIAELGAASNAIKTAFQSRFQFPLTMVGGICTGYAAMFDVADRALVGDNVGAFGYMLQGAAAFATPFAEGGPEGVLIAAVILTGAIVVALSLDEQQEYVLAYQQSTASEGFATREMARRFLRRSDEAIGVIRDHLQQDGWAAN